MMNEVQIIQLPKIFDKRGNLSFFENNKQIPFALERVYWIYDVPGGEVRGSHAFREQQEFIVAISGSFDITIHDGFDEKTYSMNRSYYGLYIPEMFWRRIDNFSTNSLALIVSDRGFNEDDYIRDFDEFISLTNV